jgi:hypothetical protein
MLLALSERSLSMARLEKLRDQIGASVAAHAAHALVHGHAGTAATTPDSTTLHESFPLWLIDREDLGRLRTDSARPARLDLRHYIHKTSQWLHLIDRGGRPFGYLHGRRLPRGKHEVTNVSVTSEALLIRQAVDQVDIASADDDARAGILECAPVGLAGIVLFPKNRRRDVSVCVFRDPRTAPNWAPSAPISGTEFITRLLELRPIRGPR